MNLLITGASGFLGNCFTNAFRVSHQIVSIGRQSIADCEHISCDLSVHIPTIPNRAFDTVIHNAGLAHQEKLKSSNPELFFRVNKDGTRHLLEAIRKLSVKPGRMVCISTVAVYGCETGSAIDEMHPLNGADPYAKSKAEAEELMLSYCRSEDIPCYILRLPLVIGKHHKGNMRRLIDSVRAGKYVQIKDNMALKSMVLADDVAALVKTLHGKPGGIYNLTDERNHRINELEDLLSTRFQKKLMKIPRWMVYFPCAIGSVIHLVWKGFPIHLGTFRKLTTTLTFSSKQASMKLQWKPENVVDFLRECPLNEL